jgi:hypothetical protein
VPGNLAYQTPLTGRFPFVASGDSWTLLNSPLPLGSLLHTQVWLESILFKRERFQIGLKTGPAHTYSWNFYGTSGNRVVRYQNMLTLAFGATLLEGAYRKQWGLQDGIPHNAYWQFSVTRTLKWPNVSE